MFKTQETPDEQTFVFLPRPVDLQDSADVIRIDEFVDASIWPQQSVSDVLLALVTQKVSWTIILVPFPFVLLIMLILGVSWVFMIVGVVLKDLQELVNLTLALLVYLSPVIARPDLVGERVYRLIMYNPLSHVVVCFRDTFQGEFHPWSWAIFIGMTLAAVAIGDTVITKTKVLINEYI